jgi:ribosomal protein S18 acetylase RimI-like enzyme
MKILFTINMDIVIIVFFLKKAPIIFNLYVYPKYRQHGHGRKLLQLVINEIRETGYQGSIRIESIPRENSITLENLIIFYKSMGLEILSKTHILEKIDKNIFT